MDDLYDESGFAVWQMALDYAVFAALILGVKHRVYRAVDGRWVVEIPSWADED